MQMRNYSLKIRIRLLQQQSWCWLWEENGNYVGKDTDKLKRKVNYVEFKQKEKTTKQQQQNTWDQLKRDMMETYVWVVALETTKERLGKQNKEKENWAMTYF